MVKRKMMLMIMMTKMENMMTNMKKMALQIRIIRTKKLKLKRKI